MSDEKKKVITISREFGSGGRLIGRRLAEKLNVPYYDKELLDKIAEESAGHDLCVCGSLGRTNAKRAVIGSVAEKVVRLAYCPVLVCRKNQE